MTPIIFYGTEDDTIATRTRLPEEHMLNEPVAPGTSPIASWCPFSVTKKDMVDTCCSTMMPAIEVLVDTTEKVELGLKMGDVWHYEGVYAQHRVSLSCLPIKNAHRGPQLPIQVALATTTTPPDVVVVASMDLWIGPSNSSKLGSSMPSIMRAEDDEQYARTLHESTRRWSCLPDGSNV